MVKHARPTRRAFSLTEMLVVLGILIVILGLVLPMIFRAQRMAKMTQCQARMREVGRALAQYMQDNEDYLPPGGSTNSGISPGSPAGVGEYRGATAALYVEVNGVPATASFSQWPEEMGGAAKCIGPPGFSDYTVPPLGFFLRKYLAPKAGNWACPAGGRNNFACGALAAPGQDDVHFGALAGHAPGDGFIPGYMYMGTADYWFGLHMNDQEHNAIPPLPGPNAAKAGMWHLLLARNIGGLRVRQLKPVRPVSLDGIVVCYERAFTVHTQGEGSFVPTLTNWQPDPNDWRPRPADYPAEGKMSSNFLYLDGHVEIRVFTSKAKFFEVLHDRIPQRWGYVDLQERAAWEYNWQAFGTKPMR